MIKTLKWIYKLGVMAERNRIKLYISEHRNTKPENPGISKPDNREEERQLREYDRQIAVWYEVDQQLRELLNPQLVAFEERPIYKSPIDGIEL